MSFYLNKSKNLKIKDQHLASILNKSIGSTIVGIQCGLTFRFHL